MITYPDYKTATNSAYKLISELDFFSIQTNVFAIAEQLKNCRVFSYGMTNYLYGIPLEFLLAHSEYGFSIKDNYSDKRIIYCNENMPLACIRFTLAHEIGHAVLGHRDEDDPAAEKEANCFARNLLCPMPIADLFCAKSEEDYVSLFNISAPMAHATVGRRSSDAYYLDEKYASIIRNKLYAYNMGYESFMEFKRYIYA